MQELMVYFFMLFYIPYDMGCCKRADLADRIHVMVSSGLYHLV